MALELSMFSLPVDLAAGLKPEVVAYIPTFRPQRLLTPEQWSCCDIAVWTSCAKTLPTSCNDAKTQMSVTCAYLAYTDRVVGTVDLDAVLTADLVNRYLVAIQGSVKSWTVSERRTRLRRALRAAAGDAPRFTRNVRPAGPAPYTSRELQTVAQTAADSEALALALACGLGAGVVVPAAIGAGPPDAAELAAAVLPLGIGDCWVGRVCARPFTDADWVTARAVSAVAGVNLTARRLRATWAFGQLIQRRPVATVVIEHQLSRYDCDAIMQHLPTLPDEQTRGLLRG
jgi:hypothetical protein